MLYLFFLLFFFSLNCQQRPVSPFNLLTVKILRVRNARKADLREYFYYCWMFPIILWSKENIGSMLLSLNCVGIKSYVAASLQELFYGYTVKRLTPARWCIWSLSYLTLRGIFCLCDIRLSCSSEGWEENWWCKSKINSTRKSYEKNRSTSNTFYYFHKI